MWIFMLLTCVFHAPVSLLLCQTCAPINIFGLIFELSCMFILWLVFSLNSIGGTVLLQRHWGSFYFGSVLHCVGLHPFLVLFRNVWELPVFTATYYCPRTPASASPELRLLELPSAYDWLSDFVCQQSEVSPLPLHEYPEGTGTLLCLVCGIQGPWGERWDRRWKGGEVEMLPMVAWGTQAKTLRKGKCWALALRTGYEVGAPLEGGDKGCRQWQHRIHCAIMVTTWSWDTESNSGHVSFWAAFILVPSVIM